MTNEEILDRAERYIERMDGVVAATLDDIGESPEALRGAGVVSAAICLIISTLVNADSDDDAFAEMAAVATTVGIFSRDLHTRLKAIIP